jgi:hypothetical protein
MPRLALLGGIGASGTAMARFFHPSAKIREKWPQNDKKRLFGVLVTGEGIRRVQHKNQMCYLVRIPEIDDSTIFHIVKKNFKILAVPAVPFDSERPAAMRVDPAPVAVPGEAVNPDRIADSNVVPNIEGYLDRDSLRGDIEEQRRQGITVDDDNEPLPENATPAQNEAQRIYESGSWTTPRACCRRSDGFAYPEGKFVNKRWDVIADMSELDLFRMCFPEEYIADVVIPETNKGLQRKMDLHEFYVFLGCIFYMSCFVGIDNRADWWSSSPIDMLSGAPFRLNAYMSRKRFDEIMSALKYTDKEAPTTFVDRFHEVRQMIDARVGVLTFMAFLHRRVDERLVEQVLPRLHVPPLQASPVRQRVPLDCRR